MLPVIDVERVAIVANGDVAVGHLIYFCEVIARTTSRPYHAIGTIFIKRASFGQFLQFFSETQGIALKVVVAVRTHVMVACEVAPFAVESGTLWKV